MSKKNASPNQEPAAGGSPAVENPQAASGSPAVENPQAASGPPATETPQADSGSPAVNTAYDDLLKNGTAILKAPTREALAELVDNIPADCRYAVGAVGRKQDGSAYTIQVDIIK